MRYSAAFHESGVPNFGSFGFSEPRRQSFWLTNSQDNGLQAKTRKLNLNRHLLAARSSAHLETSMEKLRDRIVVDYYDGKDMGVYSRKKFIVRIEKKI